jgi:hypothetical protein
VIRLQTPYAPPLTASPVRTLVTDIKPATTASPASVTS